MKSRQINLHLNNRERVLLYIFVLFLINYIFYQLIFRSQAAKFSSEALRLLSIKKQVEKEHVWLNEVERMNKENNGLYFKISNMEEILPNRIFLQDIIENIRETSQINQIKIVSLETDPPVELNNYFNTSLTIKLEGAYENIINFIASIERKQPYIGTDELTILKIPTTDQYSLVIVLHLYSFSDELG